MKGPEKPAREWTKPVERDKVTGAGAQGDGEVAIRCAHGIQ